MSKHGLPLMGLALAMSLCAGCATRGSESGRFLCPPLRTYSAAFNEKLAAELAAAPEGSPLVEAITDYFVLRRQVAACRTGTESKK